MKRDSFWLPAWVTAVCWSSSSSQGLRGGSADLGCFVSLAFLLSVPQRGKRNANAFGNQCSSWGNRREFGILGVCSLPVPGATLVHGSFFRVLEVLSSS